jgi:predicted nucleic acid-binding protein
VAVVLDTSIVVALAIADEPDHEQVRDWILGQKEELLTTPLALAEIDHVLERRAGRAVAQQVWADFERGAYQVRWWPQALEQTLRILRTEARLGAGVVDASLVALAESLSTDCVATLDHRHFRRLTVADRPFTILPADA